MSENRATIVRGKQTPFIKKTPTLDPFAYTGDCSRIAGLTEPFGDSEFTQCMDPSAPGRFREDTEIEQRPGPVTGSMMIKKSVAAQVNEEDWKQCKWTIDARYGSEDLRRDNPFNWISITRICRARFTESASDDETAYSQDDEGEVILTMPFVAQPGSKFSIRRFGLEEIDPGTEGVYGGEVDASILCIDFGAAAICPGPSRPAEGVKFAVGTAVDPDSARPYVGLTTDGGVTWTWITFNGANNTPDWLNPITGIAQSGDLIIAVSAAQGAHAVSQDGGTTWTEVIDATYAANAPYQVTIYSPNAVWICGANGYIWKSTDSGLTVATANGGTAGSVTTNNLVRIKNLSDMYVVAVGATSTIIKTANGGLTWELITAPVVVATPTINSLVMECQIKWIIVFENGEAHWTNDEGVSWTEDTQITDLSFTALNDVTLCGCERYVVVGDGASDEGIMYENIHGAPDKWEVLAVPADIEELLGVACAHQNLYIAVGEEIAAAPQEGVILRAIA